MILNLDEMDRIALKFATEASIGLLEKSIPELAARILAFELMGARPEKSSIFAGVIAEARTQKALLDTLKLMLIRIEGIKDAEAD